MDAADSAPVSNETSPLVFTMRKSFPLLLTAKVAAESELLVTRSVAVASDSTYSHSVSDQKPISVRK